MKANVSKPVFKRLRSSKFGLELLDSEIVSPLLHCCAKARAIASLLLGCINYVNFLQSFKSVIMGALRVRLVFFTPKPTCK